MVDKTKEQLEDRLETLDLLKEERRISDVCYAKKIAETAIFTLIGLFCLAIVGAILKLVIIQ